MRIRFQGLLLALALVVGVAPVGAGTATATVGAPAQEQEVDEPEFELQLTAMDPAIPDASSNLRVSSLFRNLSDTDLQQVTMVLRVGSQPLTGDQDIQNVSRGIFRPRLPIVRYSDDASVSKGGEQRFSVEIPMAELALPEPGVYPVAVEAIDGNLGSIAYLPTVLTWMPPSATQDPIDTAILWPLTLPPARDADDVITTPSLAEQFSSGGRLDGLLKAGTPFASQLSWVLDPQALETAEVLAAPHQTLEARTAADQPADAQVSTWLAALRQVVISRSAEVSAMGYAYPDSTALVAAQLSGDVVLATTSAAPTLTDQLDRTVDQTLSWAPYGSLDQPTLNVLRSAGTDAVVVSSDAIQAATASGVVELTADSGTITGIVGDAGMGLAAQLADAGAGPVLARQQFLAASANAALQDPGGERVFAPNPTWSPDLRASEEILTSATNAPWLRLVPLTRLLGGDLEQRPEATLNLDATPTPDPLTAEQTELIRWGQFVLAIIGQVTTAPSPDLQNYRSSLLRSASTWWRLEPDAGNVQLERTWAQILAEQQRLTISTAGTIAFPGEEGRVPITVANDLDVPVSVSLQLSAQPAYRLESTDEQLLDIPAGQRVSLEVPVRVIGSAPLTVDAQLFTPDGLPYGPVESFQLRTAAYSRVAQWVIWGALGILVLLVARSVITRIKAAKNTDTDTDTDTDEESNGDV